MINQPNRLSILITDDDEYNQAQLTQLLVKELPEAEITTALDGKTALELMANKARQTGRGFDLIFMDFQMPGINGELTTQMIREWEQTTKLTHPSVIITWSSVKYAPYPAADDWMPKPAQPSELEHILSLYGFLS